MKIRTRKTPRTLVSPGPSSPVSPDPSSLGFAKPSAPDAETATQSDGSEPADERRISPGVMAQERMLLGDLA